MECNLSQQRNFSILYNIHKISFSGLLAISYKERKVYKLVVVLTLGWTLLMPRIVGVWPPAWVERTVAGLLIPPA